MSFCKERKEKKLEKDLEMNERRESREKRFTFPKTFCKSPNILSLKSQKQDCNHIKQCSKHNLIKPKTSVKGLKTKSRHYCYYYCLTHLNIDLNFAHKIPTKATERTF